MDDTKREYVAHQLEEYFLDPPQSGTVTTVGDITSAHDPGEEWDIYRYGEDNFGNMYILYKNYGSEDLGYKERRDVPGRLWIRLKDHPIAFPAFAGGYPQVEMEGVNNAISSITSPDFDEFYDFTFSEDFSQMALVARNRSPGVEDSVRTYENPWVIMTPIGMAETGPVLVQMKHDDNLRDYIESGWESTVPTHLSSIGEIPTPNYQYLGAFTNRDDDIDHVYVMKSYALSGNVLSDHVKVITTRDCQISGSTYIDCDFSDQVSEQITFAKYSQGYDAHLAIAYVGRNSMGQVDSGSELDESIVLSANTSGLPTTAPVYRDQVTSHDVYEGDIRLLDYIVDLDNFKAVPASGSRFNTNADMAYIPSYPGY